MITEFQHARNAEIAVYCLQSKKGHVFLARVCEDVDNLLVRQTPSQIIVLGKAERM